MIARVLEAAGLSTASISLVREHTEAIKPPRALFVPFPFGSALGRPDDPDLQHRVLRAALELLTEPEGPVLRDFPDEDAGEERPAPLQASAVPLAETEPDPAMEATQIRRYYELW
ncbi:MAG: selenoprotein B, partial [Dehalococcoidia bacterium]